MSIRALALGAVTLLAVGCAHVHRLGRPPSADEVAAIDRSASGEPGTFEVHYFDPAHPCDPGGCAVEGPRPVLDIPPFQIERIAAVEGGQMTVVAGTGQVWRVPLSNVAGVTTRHRATLAGGIGGGVIGLGFGALFAIAASGPWFDASTGSYTQQASGIGRPIAIIATSTAVGALIGAVLGHNVWSRDTFELGDTGLSSQPSSVFGR